MMFCFDIFAGMTTKTKCDCVPGSFADWLSNQSAKLPVTQSHI